MHKRTFGSIVTLEINRRRRIEQCISSLSHMVGIVHFYLSTPGSVDPTSLGRPFTMIDFLSTTGFLTIMGNGITVSRNNQSETSHSCRHLVHHFRSCPETKGRLLGRTRIGTPTVPHMAAQIETPANCPTGHTGRPYQANRPPFARAYYEDAPDEQEEYQAYEDEYYEGAY